MKKKVNKGRKYYVLLCKNSKQVYILTNKQAVADRIGVHRNTIHNRLMNELYEDDEYIIWKEVSVVFRK